MAEDSVLPKGVDSGVHTSSKSMTQSAYRLIFDVWCTGVQESCNALQHRANAWKHFPVGGPVGDDRQASLVIAFGSTSTDADADARNNARLLWVHWIDSARLLGKPFTLDATDGIIYTPNFIKNEERFQHVIHPAIGARMKRSRTERDTVPPEVLRLKKICDPAFAPPTTGFEDIDDDQCFICAQLCNDDEGGPTPVVRMTVGSDFRCMVCLLYSHKKCCERVIGFLEESGYNHNLSTSSSSSSSFDSSRSKDLRKHEVKNFCLEMIPAILLQSPSERLGPPVINSSTCIIFSLCLFLEI